MAAIRYFEVVNLTLDHICTARFYYASGFKDQPKSAVILRFIDKHFPGLKVP